MANTFINEPAVPTRGTLPLGLNNRSIVLLTVIIILIAITTWFWSSTSVVDLGAGTNLIKSGLQEKWAQGQVVVMVRHAERCDRSSNPCLGSADGITIKGSNAAFAVGAGLQRLGLENVRMLASPLTRTEQTARFLSGQAVATQNWLGDCDSGFKDAVLQHKSPAENLVLVTHSGCIDHFERKMGVRGGDRSSDYAQALFVAVDGVHAPRIIGSLDAGQWKNLDIKRVN